MNSSTHLELNRRDFLKRTGLAVSVAGAGLFTGIEAGAANAKAVAIIAADDDQVAAAPPARWAAGQLEAALTARGIKVRRCRKLEESSADELCVWAAAGGAAAMRGQFESAKIQIPEKPESLALIPTETHGRSILLACGHDTRGLVYALLELADRVLHAASPLAALAARTPSVEQPANRIRSIARSFVSEVEDKSWYYDRAFWPRYLTMLATQRFNRFSLTLGIGYDFTSGIRDCYFHFAYPFLVSPPGHNVRIANLPDAERRRNLETLRFISDETVARGLQFQLALWTHAYLWTRSPNANYIVEGLTPETHAAYCRDALAELLRECPAITGVTFRVHGESGVPEGSYGFWKTVFEAIVKCGRTVEIDMHAKGMDQTMIDVATATGMPVNISPKFWAEHMGLPYIQGAIRKLEMPPPNAKDTGFFAKSSGSRSFLRYGYGDLLSETRRHNVLHRIWPGTQRLLLWGDPEIARGYGRASHFCDSAGLELFEPLSFKGRQGSGLPGGRDGYADSSLRPSGGDYEKYLYTYRLWGRCAYNPDCDPEVYQRFLRAQFGNGATAAGAALASASQILPLVTTAHCPSAANNNFWPEMYLNMAIVDEKRPHPYGDSPSPKRFGTVSSLDPEFFSRIDDFASELLKRERTPKCSPLDTAQRLLNSAAEVDKFLARAKSQVHDAASPDFRRLALDSAMQADLGRFFGHKLRAGVLYALFERTHHRPALEAALKTYRQARTAWAALVDRSKDAYRPDISFGYAGQLRGHWADRLPAIDADIADMRKFLEQPPTQPAADATMDPKVIDATIRAVFAKPPVLNASVSARFHTPPSSFRRNQPLRLEVSLARGGLKQKPVSMTVHYRRVNQAELWQVMAMENAAGLCAAVIPPAYTDSPFPLQYYFELRDRAGQPSLYPGFWNRPTSEPYFVVRQ